MNGENTTDNQNKFKKQKFPKSYVFIQFFYCIKANKHIMNKTTDYNIKHQLYEGLTYVILCTHLLMFALLGIITLAVVAVVVHAVT